VGKFIDLTGQPFGKLIVESFAGKDKHGKAMWNCVCECSNRVTCNTGGLRSKNNITCGRCPNRIEPFGDSIVIWLESKERDIPCWIDAADYNLVKDYRWSAAKKCKSAKTLYARAHVRGGKRSNQEKVYMHALIMSKGADHKDGDGLNNRRENLRPASNAENARNKGLTTANTTGFKGVFRRRSGRFHAQIKAAGKLHCLGTYDTAIEAARAYNRAAKELHGKFAVVLNELPEDDLILNQKPEVRS
jgi:hypothetical protein